MADYTLPDLPYDYGALEPHVSGEIMELHHSKHHATYVKGANTALEQMAEARALINGFAGSRRLLAHALITPGQQGWMDEVDKAITVHKPDS